MPRTLKTYSAKERNMYLLGMAGQNILYNVVGASLAYYLQFTILIPAIAVSVITAAARVWDAVNDPMMGTIVDKTRSKIGKCRPYLLAVPAPVFITTVMCFLNFGFFDPSKGMLEGRNALIIFWAVFSYLLWEMVYTIGDIPLWGVTALMTEVEKDRSRLLALARIASGIGGGIALLAVQPAALKLGQLLAPRYKDAGIVTAEAAGERAGFIAAALIFSAAGYLLFQQAGIFVREKIPASSGKHTMKENFSLMWTNKPFRQILLSGLMGSPKFLLGLAAMPLVTYYYASKDSGMALIYIVLLGGGMFIGQFAAMGTAPKVANKYGKKHVYNYSNLAGAIPFAAIFVMYQIAPMSLTRPVFIAISFVLFILGGAANGFTSVMSTLMISDAVDYEEYHNGTRPDGVFFSGQSFLTKLNTGIATLLSGLAYSAVGFSDAKVAELNAFIAAGNIPREAPQYQKFMMILFFIVSIPPAIGSILSVIPTWHYCLDDKEHERILGELNARRHAAEAEKAGDGS